MERALVALGLVLVCVCDWVGVYASSWVSFCLYVVSALCQCVIHESCDTDVTTSFEPSKKAKKLRQLMPRICPAKGSLGFKPMAINLEVGTRRIAHKATGQSCSVCSMRSTDPSKNKKTRWRCEYPAVRAISLAGFAGLPDINGLGQHFLLFIKNQRLRLEKSLLDPNYGYFSTKISDILKVFFLMQLGRDR